MALVTRLQTMVGGKVAEQIHRKTLGVNDHWEMLEAREAELAKAQEVAKERQRGGGATTKAANVGGGVVEDPPVASFHRLSPLISLLDFLKAKAELLENQIEIKQDYERDKRAVPARPPTPPPPPPEPSIPESEPPVVEFETTTSSATSASPVATPEVVEPPVPIWEPSSSASRKSESGGDSRLSESSSEPIPPLPPTPPPEVIPSVVEEPSVPIWEPSSSASRKSESGGDSRLSESSLEPIPPLPPTPPPVIPSVVEVKQEDRKSQAGQEIVISHAQTQVTECLKENLYVVRKNMLCGTRNSWAGVPVAGDEGGQ